jgi:hypothetical protein
MSPKLVIYIPFTRYILSAVGRHVIVYPVLHGFYIILLNPALHMQGNVGQTGAT